MKGRLFSTVLQYMTQTEGISTISNTDADGILCTALDIGQLLLKSGGEIFRVEDTIERICKAYGAEHVEVFCLTSFLTAAIRMPNGQYSTQSRRVRESANHMYRIELVNSLSREICQKPVELPAVQERIRQIKKSVPYPKWIYILAAMLGAGMYCMFFGGTWRDFVACAPISAIMMAFSLYKPDFVRSSAEVFINSIVAGFLSHLLVIAGLGINIDKIMIGTIMILIPGLSFGISLRDLICDDTLSGTIRLIQALKLAIIIAVGYGISILTLGGFV